MDLVEDLIKEKNSVFCSQSSELELLRMCDLGLCVVAERFLWLLFVLVLVENTLHKQGWWCQQAG
jgi:hypothetical protein